jgi:hypothetical protein
MRYILLFLLLCANAMPIFAQTTFVKGNSSLELSGVLQVSYNYRLNDAANLDYKKNHFGCDAARIALNGIVKNKWQYEFQLDLASLSGLAIDKGASSPLINLYVAYTGIENLIIKAGYQRIAFSNSSMTPFFYAAYLQRPEMMRGDFFARRDVGVSLETSLLNQCLTLNAGAFTGLGEQSLLDDNDASGQLEYTARADYAYPSKYRYRDYDLAGSPALMFRIGANGRYANKRAFSGADLIRTIDGEKYLYGGDFCLQYAHFSAQFEILQARLQLRNPATLAAFHTTFKRAGGVIGQLNYTIPALRSGISVRYDDFNPNDLVLGDGRPTVSAAYAYFISDYRAMLRVQYWHRLKDANAPQAWGDDQVRAALQFMF